MKINIKKLIFNFIYFIVAIIISCFILKIDRTNLNDWIKYGTLIALILFCIQTIFFKIITKKIISLEYLFLVFTYVFYMSQNILLFIKYDFGELAYSTFYARSAPSLYIQSGQYSLLCIIYISVGILLYNVININDKSTEKNKDIRYNQRIAFKLIFLGAPFELYSFISKIIAMISSGYLESHNVGGGTIIELMSGIFFAGLILLMTTSFNKKYMCTNIYIFILMYNLLSMFTGLRAYATIKILILTYVYLKINNKINFKYLIKLSFGCIFLLYLLVVIRNTRLSGLNLKDFNFTINGNLILDVISEFSLTGRVITMAFANITRYAHGMSILCGFLAIIPGWSHIFGTDLMYKYYTFEALDQQAWGSAFASDFYFDFGFIGGIIACFVFGMIVCSFCRKLDLYIEDKNYAKIAMFSYFVMQLIYTVRSYIFRLPRYFVWFFIVYFILQKVHINTASCITVKGGNS